MKGQKFYGKGTVAHVESPWIAGHIAVSYTHLTLPTNREV